MNPHQALIEAAEAFLDEPEECDLREKLKSAISSAKGAEEAVETMYRVDVMDGIGWVMTASDRFHSTEVSAYARADRAFGSAEKVKAVRVVRVESKSTVISVREKEGL